MTQRRTMEVGHQTTQVNHWVRTPTDNFNEKNVMFGCKFDTDYIYAFNESDHNMYNTGNTVATSVNHNIVLLNHHKSFSIFSVDRISGNPLKLHYLKHDHPQHFPRVNKPSTHNTTEHNLWCQVSNGE